MAVPTHRLDPGGLAEARRVLESAKIDQQVPRPRIGDWWGDLLARVAEVLAGLFDLEAATVGLVLRIGAWTLIVAAAAVVAWFFWSWWRGQARRPVDRGAGVELLGVAGPGSEEVSWGARFERAVERGDTSAALEALWNLLAVRLGIRVVSLPEGERDQRSGLAGGDRRWTGARLLALARTAGEGVDGSAVSEAVRSLERWTYGGRPVSLDELADLRRRMELAIPGAVG